MYLEVYLGERATNYTKILLRLRRQIKDNNKLHLEVSVEGRAFAFAFAFHTHT
jgi:hypothetical protein